MAKPDSKDGHLQAKGQFSLKKEEKSVPDQKGKPTRKPTARWGFQLFVGIHVAGLARREKINTQFKGGTLRHPGCIILLEFLFLIF